MMRKWCVLLILGLLLTGCGTEETYETLADEMVQAVMAEPREVRLNLPEETLLPAMESDSGTLYLCRDYDVTVQTLESGDLEETIRAVSGYDRDDLTVISTDQEGLARYEFVWTSAGEAGDQVGRAAILDDGSYHYVLTAMIDAEKISEYQEIWNGLFASFGLV